jgi:hypothetical protein
VPSSTSAEPPPDLARVQLDVYDRGKGGSLWNPEHGDVDVPDGWGYLPAGDHFVTRQVKAAGVFWTVWRPRGRNRDHRRKLGVYAPEATITAARERAQQTEERRAKQRVSNQASRDKVEDRYRIELADAVRVWLAFAPQHARLADEIASGVADHAAVVGSGRVGRTRVLSLEERAALAARAYIRHRYTDYEAQLDRFGLLDDDFYLELKADAQWSVDEFLAAHRDTPPA